MKNRKFLATFSLSLVVAAATVFCSMPVQAAEITMAKTAAAVTYGNTSSSEAALLRSIFDYEYYKKMNPDVVAKFGDSREALFNHFAKFGIYEGRSLSANFNVSAYASAYPDLKGKFGADIVKYYIHYAAVGSKEDRPITTLKAAADAGITVTSVADPTVVLTPAAIKAAEAKGITDPAAAMAAAPVASSGSSSSSSGGGGSASTKQNATKPEDNKEETPSEPAANVAVTGVTLDKITASIEVGEELALKATVKPENASVKKVTWSSSDTAVATVAEGKVTGVAAGTATITVTADGGKTATCTVTVTEPSEPEEPVAVENITVTAAGDATSITKGQTLQLTVEVTPENATNKEVEWSSDVETVTVSATGLVSVEADETATEVTITATAKDGSEVSDNITFTIADPVAVTGVTLNKSTTSIVEGTTETLEATVAPVDATNKNVTWSSDNEDVATVEDGVVTGVAAGTATITVTTEDGDFEAECEVTVTADETAPTLSLVSATRTAAETATLAFTSSEAGTYYYLVLAAAAEAPNAATIKAQGDAVAKGTAAATASANSVSITGLTADTAYKAYVVVEDAAVNISDVSTTDIASTAAEPPEDFTSLAIGVEGNVFTATASPSEGVTYQWYEANANNKTAVDDLTAIDGATAATFTLTDNSHDGNYLYVVASKTGYNDKLAVSSEAASYSAAPEDFTSLAIGVEGNVFTATASPSEGVTYQWYEANANNKTAVDDLTAIDGATAATFTLTDNSHDGNYLYVVASKTGYNDKLAVSSEAASYSAAPEDFTSLAIGVEGNVFTATASPSEGVTYQWYEANANNKTAVDDLTAIDGATAATFTLTDNSHDGNYLYVVASKTGYNDKLAVSSEAASYSE